MRCDDIYLETVNMNLSLFNKFCHFASTKGIEIGINLLIMIFGLGLIIFIARRAPLARRWELFVQSRLKRLKIFEDDSSIDELLHISDGYGVVRVQLLDSSQYIGQTLSTINAGLEHSFVLGIERDNEWIPTPRLTKKLLVDDYMVIYGKLENLAEHFC